ncbi:hypothetical protein NDU88_007591 [Pleurodeles waltl]|uniref:Uncharacterized protein n=1 Tax=Pleurodeles waltl TaxID=8319 RepID=A0AAV7PQE4_PLEWA|nr:hypothetical protein NDU88_007591 [Pleurodeles waltl]
MIPVTTWHLQSQANKPIKAEKRVLTTAAVDRCGGNVEIRPNKPVADDGREVLLIKRWFLTAHVKRLKYSKKMCFAACGTGASLHKPLKSKENSLAV